jgi:hypothetical protein
VFVIFVAVVGGWRLTAGVGVLLRSKWGYFIFKSFLYLSLLCFPISTFIAYKSLKYTKRNDIKTLFGFGADQGQEVRLLNNLVERRRGPSKEEGSQERKESIFQRG